jgi:malonate transporter
VQSAVLFALLRLLHVISPFAREALVCCSFPLATVVGLFAARYKAVESEAASMLLVSTLALAITVPAILWLPQTCLSLRSFSLAVLRRTIHFRY